MPAKQLWSVSPGLKKREGGQVIQKIVSPSTKTSPQETAEKRVLMNEIETISKKCLTVYSYRSPACEFSSKIIEFRDELIWHNIISYKIFPEGVTHSEHIVIRPKNLVGTIANTAEAVGSVFNTKSYFLVNGSSKKFSIIFSGMPDNVKASFLVFKKFQSLFREVRGQYIQSLGSQTKTARKKTRSDEFMESWLEEIANDLKYSCHSGGAREKKLLDRYIRSKFVTSEDLERCNQFCKEFFEIILKSPDQTIAETKNIIFKKYGENILDETIKTFERSRNEDVVVVFPVFDDL